MSENGHKIFFKCVEEELLKVQLQIKQRYCLDPFLLHGKRIKIVVGYTAKRDENKFKSSLKDCLHKTQENTLSVFSFLLKLLLCSTLGGLRYLFALFVTSPGVDFLLCSSSHLLPGGANKR